MGLEELILFIGEFESGHGGFSTSEFPPTGIGPMNNVQIELTDRA
jgi:hypothetical protein